MKRLLIVLVLVSLSACVTPTNRYRATCQSWMNQDANNLIRAWGYPQQTGKMPNGNTVLVYVKQETDTDPVMHLPMGGLYGRPPTYFSVGGDTNHHFCKTIFEVAPNGRIVFWRFDGDICR